MVGYGAAATGLVVIAGFASLLIAGQPRRWIVGYTPGGTADIIARVGRLQTEHERNNDPAMLPYEVMIRGAMQQALIEHGTIRGAALALGMPKSTFADKAREWGLITTRRRKRRTRGNPR